jgi:hypothetical protein
MRRKAKLNVTYIPGKMFRKSFLFSVKVYATADPYLAREFLMREFNIDENHEHFNNILNYRYAQMLAAFKVNYEKFKRETIYFNFSSNSD